jgi:hypothetical protein
MVRAVWLLRRLSTVYRPLVSPPALPTFDWYMDSDMLVGECDLEWLGDSAGDR